MASREPSGTPLSLARGRGGTSGWIVLKLHRQVTVRSLWKDHSSLCLSSKLASLTSFKNIMGQGAVFKG